MLRRESLQEKIQAEKLGDNIKKIQDKHRVVKRAFYSIFFFCIACISECRNSAQVSFSAKQQSTFHCDRNVMNFVTAAPTRPGPHESTQPRVVPLLCLFNERIEVSAGKDVVAMASGSPDKKQKDKLTKSTD